MANKPLNGVLQQVRKLAAIQSARADADAQLLERFVACNDEAALTILVERHAPMVLGVCRRALGCVHDAEDACQATFLVFARKAATIRNRAALGGWLHSVALRVTANLKRERARRERRDRVACSRTACDPADDVTWTEVQTALDEELARLPERFRAVLVLCYLEGKTRDEAADQLGVSTGTLHGLLERGRKMLALRLTRRGVTLSAGLFGVALADGVLQAALSPTQLLNTAHASSLFALGKPVGETVSAAVLNLSQQVLKGMFMTKLKLLSAGVTCAAALLVTAVGFTFAQSPAAEKTDGNAELLWLRVHFVQAGQKDSDEAFIRRVSMDLRGCEPSPAELHFFVNSKDPKRREMLVDLFIKERETKKALSREQAAMVAEELARRVQTNDKNRLAIERLVKVKGKYSESKATKAVSKAEIDALKAVVEAASLTVVQKEIVLKTARNATEKELDLLQAELRVAQAVLAQARANLDLAEKKLAK